MTSRHETSVIGRLPPRVVALGILGFVVVLGALGAGGLRDATSPGPLRPGPPAGPGLGGRGPAALARARASSRSRWRSCSRSWSGSGCSWSRCCRRAAGPATRCGTPSFVWVPLGGLALRGHPVLALLGAFGSAATTLIWSITERFVGWEEGLYRVVSPTAVVVIAVGIALLVRSTPGRCDRARAEQLEAARLSAGARAAEAERRTRLAQIEQLAAPVLLRLRDGDGVDERLAAECRLLEAALRDGIRGRYLVDPAVRETLWSARTRAWRSPCSTTRAARTGSTTGSTTSPGVADVARRCLVEVVEKLENGVVTARLPGPDQATVVVITPDAGDVAVACRAPSGPGRHRPRRPVRLGAEAETSWSSPCARAPTPAPPEPRQLDDPSAPLPLVPPERPALGHHRRARRDEPLARPQRLQRGRRRPRRRPAPRAGRARAPPATLRWMSALGSRAATCDGRTEGRPGARPAPARRPGRLQHHPGRQPPRLVARAVHQQAVRCEPRAQPVPDRGHLGLVVLPQHVERPDEQRPAPPRAAPARNRRGRRPRPAPRAAAPPRPAPRRSPPPARHVGPDRPQPGRELQHGDRGPAVAQVHDQRVARAAQPGTVPLDVPAVEAPQPVGGGRAPGHPARRPTGAGRGRRGPPAVSHAAQRRSPGRGRGPGGRTVAGVASPAPRRLSGRARHGAPDAGRVAAAGRARLAGPARAHALGPHLAAGAAGHGRRRRAQRLRRGAVAPARRRRRAGGGRSPAARPAPSRTWWSSPPACSSGTWTPARTRAWPRRSCRASCAPSPPG